MKEELRAIKVDGILVSVPAEGQTYYIHEVSTPYGKELKISPLLLPEARVRMLLESIKEAMAKKPEVAKEVI